MRTDFLQPANARPTRTTREQGGRIVAAHGAEANPCPPSRARRLVWDHEKAPYKQKMYGALQAKDVRRLTSKRCTAPYKQKMYGALQAKDVRRLQAKDVQRLQTKDVRRLLMIDLFFWLQSNLFRE
jgi:hypothetical protein